MDVGALIGQPRLGLGLGAGQAAGPLGGASRLVGMFISACDGRSTTR